MHRFAAPALIYTATVAAVAALFVVWASRNAERGGV